MSAVGAVRYQSTTVIIEVFVALVVVVFAICKSSRIAVTKCIAVIIAIVTVMCSNDRFTIQTNLNHYRL